MNSPRVGYGSATLTKTFQGGTGSHGATLKDGVLPKPSTDSKTSPAVITAVPERVDIKAEMVEESTIAHEIKINGIIEHEDYGTDSPDSSDVDSLDGATVINANGTVDDTPKNGTIARVVASSKLEVQGIKFTRGRKR